MIDDIVKAYAEGLTGYIDDPRAKAQYLESQKYGVFNEPNLRGMGAGKRAMLYAYARELDSKSFTEKQTTGDCTSHAHRNCRDITRAIDIRVNRKPYDWFQVGATEPTYGARGHAGEGMSPARAARFERDVGFLARKNYEGVVDLSRYNSSIGSRWGGGGVPSNVQELCRQNKVGVITNVRSQEELMDAMANGYGACSGQMAAWSSRANSKGVHPRTSPGWAHAMAIAFYDDTKEFYPFRVWGIVNSWGAWNQKPDYWPDAYPPYVPGMIITTADDFDVCVRSGDCWVYSAVDGYPPQKLPDYGTVGLLEKRDA